MALVATQPLPPGGWVWGGGGSASEWETKSEVAQKWPWSLHNPCSLGGGPTLRSRGQNQKWATSGPGGYISPRARGGPRRFRTGDEIRGGPQMALVATQPLPPTGPKASQRGAKSQVAHKWAGWLHNPCCLGAPYSSKQGTESEMAHNWARWLHKPCRLGGPQCFTAGHKFRYGPQVGRVAT